VTTSARSKARWFLGLLLAAVAFCLAACGQEETTTAKPGPTDGGVPPDSGAAPDAGTPKPDGGSEPGCALDLAVLDQPPPEPAPGIVRCDDASSVEPASHTYALDPELYDSGMTYSGTDLSELLVASPGKVFTGTHWVTTAKHYFGANDAAA
jgi:hypothetical protein